MTTLLCGVDEAGRGPWAGPVFAAAVILDLKRPIDGLKDSKCLSPTKREALAAQIYTHALAACVASSTVEEIELLNILQATLLAMERAVSGLAVKPDVVLIDGLAMPKLTMATQAIVRGDQLVPAISAASILAKVARDDFMVQQHEHYPMYGFDRHKGYGTSQHHRALQQYGPCPLHRRNFRPIEVLLRQN